MASLMQSFLSEKIKGHKKKEGGVSRFEGRKPYRKTNEDASGVSRMTVFQKVPSLVSKLWQLKPYDGGHVH